MTRFFPLSAVLMLLGRLVPVEWTDAVGVAGGVGVLVALFGPEGSNGD